MHESTKWIRGEIIVVAIIIALLGMYRHPMLLSHQWHRLLHIFGAVLLLGNIIVTAAWMFLAERTRNASSLRFASEAVNWADVFFTVPGVFLLITNGDILAELWGGVFKTGWIAVSLALFVVSGVLWAGFLLRYQNRLIRLSRETSGIQLLPEFIKILHKWYAVGATATVILLISLAFMVFKPVFW